MYTLEQLRERVKGGGNQQPNFLRRISSITSVVCLGYTSKIAYTCHILSCSVSSCVFYKTLQFIVLLKFVLLLLSQVHFVTLALAPQTLMYNLVVFVIDMSLSIQVYLVDSA